MNKENHSSSLRARNMNENSGLNAKETDSLKSMIKENVTSQQYSNLKRTSSFKKNDNNENIIKFEENTKENSKQKGKIDNEAKLPLTSRRAFEGLNRLSADAPLLVSKSNHKPFRVLTEDIVPVTEIVRSDAFQVEETAVLDQTHLVNLHHKLTKDLHRSAAAQASQVEALKERLNRLKKDAQMKREKITRMEDKKMKIIREGKLRKSHIEELKREIKEKEEMQEELLAILKPIENDAKVQRLKQKQDCVVELLNTLSFLNYEISELQAKV